jgi:hypothetical protein
MNALTDSLVTTLQRQGISMDKYVGPADKGCSRDRPQFLD